ncbi:MAG: T9SS type A sorting domain-containing protein [Chlorobi bacterium]|nr:T9SS type A sorting domain-containing protein [Chlorobiota bacterium]
MDGKKFFIKGIGYEAGAIPGKLPWERTFDPDLLRFDMRRITSAGFNTIRTWSAFTKQELDVLKEFNIKIIMGIWIDPKGNFSDETFVENAKTEVSNVLSYSKNYDNIIAYLIMNEPLPETIVKAGYDNTVALWKQLEDIIHTQHPYRPVSIANTSTGTFINPAVFDFDAYNVYPYNPVTVNYLFGYQNFIHYLTTLDISGHPLVITEYGLSVSPTGPGNWGYGGNSLSEQRKGDLYMYKSLVDGGASGSCIFNYSDGWWKGGNQYQHDDKPEEWFGLVGYNNLSDKYGEERPVWDAVKTFQSAIITQPQNGGLYLTKIPVEVFANDTIRQIEIMMDSQQVYQHSVDNNYLRDTLHFNISDVKVSHLIFNCYDSIHRLVKTETKTILVSKRELELPKIEINIENPNYWQDGFIKVHYHIVQSPPFTPSSQLETIFYPHVGFNYGEKYQWSLPQSGQSDFYFQYQLNPDVNVVTLGAAFDVDYQGFKKRIIGHLLLSRINTISTDVYSPNRRQTSIQIVPNPVKSSFKVTNSGIVSSPSFRYSIFTSSGVPVMKSLTSSWSQPIHITELKPGIYYIRIYAGNESLAPITKKIVKLGVQY